VLIVVGFKMGLVIEAVPDVVFAYNEHYHRTNTSKSLLKALRLSSDGGVVWLNGDVVFDPAVLDVMAPLIEADESFVCVNTAVVGEEEIKYTVDAEGYVAELSKGVRNALGEAIGINYVSAADKPALIARLDECADTDYFERGLELAIERDGMRVRPLDISGYAAVEVDFEQDLDRANDILTTIHA
jgi:choline kinase